MYITVYVYVHVIPHHARQLFIYIDLLTTDTGHSVNASFINVFRALYDGANYTFSFHSHHS